MAASTATATTTTTMINALVLRMYDVSRAHHPFFERALTRNKCVCVFQLVDFPQKSSMPSLRSLAWRVFLVL